MVGKSFAKILLVLMLIGLFVYSAFYGVDVFGKKIPNFMGGIKKGLDLTGGSVILFEAQADKVTDSEMKTTVDVMRKRLDSLKLFEAAATRQGEKRIRIEIPAVDNPDEAKATLGQTAMLEFVDSNGQVVMSGKDKDIKDAQPKFGSVSQTQANENYVELTLTPNGSKKFAVATERISKMGEGKNTISIKLDKDIISSPRVEEKIDSDKCIIHGQFTAESAASLANIIRAGNLPFSLKDVQVSTIGPTLGEKALSSSFQAATIGLIIILLFMLFFYRLPGLMADIALIGYIAITANILGWSHFNLSLPGIAGMILTIGVAVDANVIIFERIKEELKSGKTLKASVDAGFNRAFTAVFDSNMTTLIAAVVLYMMGTGGIKGFAITLGLGILVSLFTAVVVTKFLMHAIIGIKVKNIKLYGA